MPHHPMLSGDRFRLGTFSTNCSSGMTPTKVPERWVNSWDNNLKLAKMLDEAGIDFMLPIARWIGYGGETDFHGGVLETMTWAAGLLAATKNIAVFATIVPFVFGTIIGALVGYAGGWAEALFGRIVDAVITFPFLVLVIAIVSVLGPGLVNMYIAVGVVGWVFYARIIAAEIKVQKRLDYADAGRAMGYTHLRIIFRHLLPNAITPAIVYWMTDMALAILLGSSLGYLGLGAQPPAAEWGVQIADGKNFMSTAWWISVFPGLAIVLTGLGFTLTGDGLAELLRTKR